MYSLLARPLAAIMGAGVESPAQPKYPYLPLFGNSRHFRLLLFARLEFGSIQLWWVMKWIVIGDTIEISSYSQSFLPGELCVVSSVFSSFFCSMCFKR